MTQKEPHFNWNSKKKIFSKYSIILGIIIGISSLIRFYYFPFDVPLNSDAIYYFWYSSDIYEIGALPNNWTPSNNGWPIFVSIFFTAFDSKDIFELMQMQRILSVIISISIAVPVYFLCKKFVEKKFAVIGASLVAFDPRLMINSFFGITDPLYLLLIITSLTLFLHSNQKLVYISFIFIALSTLVRSEGLVFFVGMLIIFFIRYRKEKLKIILKYILIIGIFNLIILPSIIYQLDTNGEDGIILRTSNSVIEILDKKENNLVFAFEVLIKYLIWITIPNFIIFIPLGIYLIFKKKTIENISIIILSGIMLIPALYAYFVPALDTRYLYVFLPMFSILAALSIQKIIINRHKANLIIIIIILAIIISSILFYDYKKIDYEHEKESFEVMQKISPLINGTNTLYPETSYFNTIQTIKQWPNLYSNMKFDISVISTNNHNSMEEFIINSQDQGLTHIIIDDNVNRDKFLNELFFDEKKYSYLKKVFDSKDEGFNYHIKVFELDYNSLNKGIPVLIINE